MVTETDQTSEISTDTAASGVESSDGGSTESTDSGVETSAAPETGEKVTEPVVPAYTPNYKMKVYDEEKEIDDPFLKGLIKDADSEKKIKEYAQKALAFETVKGRNERLKEEYTQYQQTAQPVIQYYNEASKLLNKGDLDGFFELINIPKQKIFEYAVRKAEEAQLPQEQQQQIQFQKQIQREREMLANQNQTLMSQQQKQLSDFRAQELNWVISRPEVHSIAQVFDQRVGKQGAFRQAVIDKGLAHFAATNGREDLSAEQATQEVMKLLGAVVQPTANGIPTPQQAPLIPQNSAPPIIPNVTGRGTSPVRKQVRSLDDLKKKRDELMNSSRQ